ncbi:MAG: hypothetical protein IPP55_17020 [Anaerolineales bacterium]|nr:hypothetical protein [Anaerolineales bacterium]
MNDDERTYIAVDDAKALADCSTKRRFHTLTDWFDGLKISNPCSMVERVPSRKNWLLEKVEFMLPDLFADEEIYLIHGDFHHC